MTETPRRPGTPVKKRKKLMARARSESPPAKTATVAAGPEAAATQAAPSERAVPGLGAAVAEAPAGDRQQADAATRPQGSSEDGGAGDAPPGGEGGAAEDGRRASLSSSLAQAQKGLRHLWETWIWRPAPPPGSRRPRRTARPSDESGEAIGAEATAEATDAAPARLPGTVYLIPISHLDTQWRWTVRDTVAKFLPATVRDNVAAFEKFPSYRVNFDGAFRYRLLAEHHPADFATVKRWVEAGRWQVSGATWDALDVNLPAPESFVRHVLYGRRWFREHLGRDPRDLFLPDCFGFGAQVPVLAAHCGLVGFATSKLRRFDDMRSAFGIPFPLGWWEGVDGSRLLSVLEPGGYGEVLAVPPADDPEATDQIERHHENLGEGLAVRFFGIGDKGGAPGVKSLQQLEKAVADAGPVRTQAVGSSELLTRLAAELPADRLPVYRGELLLSVHGTGCYTSQAGMKRWNAHNERLAAAAERAATAAAWLGACPYPAERLREAWQRFLWHQFHDDLTGTSIAAAYDISWQDEAIAAGEFGEVLRSSVAAVARGLDTRCEGVPLVVFNPLPLARRELVAARVEWEVGVPITVIGPDGVAVPAQVDAGASPAGASGPGPATIHFLADLPPLGFAVFDLRRGESPATPDPELRCSRSGMETSRWRLMLDREGNLSSLFDKRLDRELLGAPLKLELFANRSRRFPAWEIHWQDLEPGPVAAVEGPADVRPLGCGPAAVALEVHQRYRGSRFVTRYRLAAGEAADALEVELGIRWRTRGRLLKATLTTSAAGRDATYDVGVTGVRRGPSTSALYEVPAQSWADLAQDGNAFGVAVLTDRPHGWDHPLPHVLRMTLLHTPATGRRFPHQSFQDLGDHQFRFGIAGHRGDWRTGGVPALATRFRQPPMAFTVPAGPGPLGRRWSFLTVDGDAELAALKQHEDGNGEWVVRLLDPTGKAGSAKLHLPADVTGARAVDGTEDTLATAAPIARAAGAAPLTVELAPHRPLALALQVAAPPHPLAPPRTAPVGLRHDRAVVTRQGERCGDGLGRRGLAFPAELFPATLTTGGIPFTLSQTGAHATACGSQRLVLPEGEWDQLWLLAASTAGAREVTLQAGPTATALVVPSTLEPLAVPDSVPRFGVGPYAFWRVRNGHTIEAPVAWVAGHLHDREGRDLPYRPACLFALPVPLPAGAREVALPNDGEVLLFAATVSAGAGGASAAWAVERIGLDS
jgi:alpha-mannosidase